MLPKALLYIADKVDALGLHKEAEILDGIIERRADILAYKEKPFIARLAKIIFALRNYKSGEPIQEHIVLPLSDASIAGMTRQEAVIEVQKHLEKFINQYLLPTFEKKYKKTSYESKYRGFIKQVYSLLQNLQGLFSTRSEQQGVREAVNAIEHTKKILGKLIVYIRSRDSSDEVIPEDAETELVKRYKILNDLEMAVKQNNAKAIESNLEKIWLSFPTEIVEYNDAAAVYFAIEVAFDEGALPFSQSEIEGEALDLLGKESREELMQTKSDFEKYEKEVNSFSRLKQRIDDLMTRITNLLQGIQEHDGFLPKIPANQQELNESIRQYLTYVKTMQGTYILPQGFEHYKKTPSAKYSRCKALEGEVSNLEMWLDRYLKEDGGKLKDSIPFSTFLSKGVDSKLATKALNIINRNAQDLKGEVEKDLSILQISRDKAHKEYRKLSSEQRELQNRVLWEKFHREYITKMIQTILHALSPETKGEGTTKQAFDQILNEFNEVLNY